MFDKYEGLSTLLAEHDKEIFESLKRTDKIKNQMNGVINELALNDRTKEEHESLIKELVKESKLLQ